RPLRAPPLLVQIPTATYEAYNAWGGDSLYPGGTRQVGVTGTSQGVEVSYDRPYESQTGAGQFFIGDVAVVRFLERYGYPVGYTTQASIDGDPGQAQGSRALIDVGHSEYWSAGDRGAFERALSGGASLIFLSSDTMAWRVRFEPASGASGQAGQSGHRIVAYKQLAALDPSRGERTGVFADGGAALVGSAYDGCITPRLAGSSPPTYRYYEWRGAARPPGAERAVGAHWRARRDEHPWDRGLRAGHAPPRHTAGDAAGGVGDGRDVHARERADARARDDRRDDPLQSALGSPGVRDRRAWMGVRAGAGPPGFSGCAALTGRARGGHDPEPARAGDGGRLGPLARGEPVEPGVAGEIDVLTVADHRVEGSGVLFEEDPAGRDAQAV